MKRFLPWLLGAVCLWLWRDIPKTDLSKLYPVQTVVVVQERDGVRIYADDFAVGSGSNFRKALSDLKANAPAEIFLETADYLLVKNGGEAIRKEAACYLRPGTKTAEIQALPDLKTLGDYLNVHQPGKNLRQAAKEDRNG